MYLHNMNSRNSEQIPVEFQESGWIPVGISGGMKSIVIFYQLWLNFFFDFSMLHIQNCCKFLELSISLWEDAID